MDLWGKSESIFINTSHRTWPTKPLVNGSYHHCWWEHFATGFLCYIVKCWWRSPQLTPAPSWVGLAGQPRPPSGSLSGAGLSIESS